MVVGELTVECDLLVIGGGPGGYVAAIRAAQLGLDVTLVEDSFVGGVCLNVGCIPSKALISVANRVDQIQHSKDMGIAVGSIELDFPQVMTYKSQVVSRLTSGVARLLEGNGVNVIEGRATLIAANLARVQLSHEVQQVRFKSAILATGSRPFEIPGIPFDHEVVVDSTDALSFESIPERLVIVGGGYIGLEIGTAYRKLGSQVTVFEATDRLLGTMDSSLVSIVARRLKSLGVEINLSCSVSDVTVSGSTALVTFRKGEAVETLEADKVVVAVGRVPNSKDLGLEHLGVKLDSKGFVIVDEQRRTSIGSIFAIGDVAGGPLLAHKASFEGKVAATVAAGQRDAYDPVSIPAVVFTDPEIASVGLSLNDAERLGYQAVSARFPFAGIGRAVSMNETDGFCQVVYDEKTGVILGLHVVGPDASDLLGEASVLVEFGANLEDLSRTVHAHPTLAEIFMEVAEVALGFPVHQLPKKSH